MSSPTEHVNDMLPNSILYNKPRISAYQSLQPYIQEISDHCGDNNDIIKYCKQEMDKLLTTEITMSNSTNPPTDINVLLLNNMNQNKTLPASEFQSSLTPRVKIKKEGRKRGSWER